MSAVVVVVAEEVANREAKKGRYSIGSSPFRVPASASSFCRLCLYGLHAASMIAARIVGRTAGKARLGIVCFVRTKFGVRAFGILLEESRVVLVVG